MALLMVLAISAGDRPSRAALFPSSERMRGSLQPASRADMQAANRVLLRAPLGQG